MLKKNSIFPMIMFCVLHHVSSTAVANESINSLLFYFGSGPELTAQSIPLLAEYDLLVIDRHRYSKVNGNTWDAIKSVSPSTKIMLYQLGPWVADNDDAVGQWALNNLGRYNNSRGSSQGSVNKDHPDWFLKNSNGQLVKSIRDSHLFALDYGNKQVVDYWAAHTVEDVVSQEWRADGIYIDAVALCSTAFLNKQVNYVPVKYSDCASWNSSMSDFVSGVSSVLHQNNQLVMVNTGNSINESAAAAWSTLSQRNTAPDILVEEGAFAVSWGEGNNNDVRYWPLAEWKRQIDLPYNVARNVAFISHTDLSSGEQGVSFSGETVSHSQVLRYAVGSYLLARTATGPTTYFTFDDGRRQKQGGYKTLRSTALYDKFNIGIPVAKYEKTLPDQNLYFRKYANGYVYVNPTSNPITAIKAESDAVFSSDYENARKVGADWYFDLKPHDAAIVRSKGATFENKQGTPPSPPVLKIN